MIFDKTKIAEDSKLFYKPGDIVILKHEEIGNRVPMYIVEKVTRQFKKEEIVENAFVGFRCRWFDKKTEHSSYGYCHAMKHAYLSKNWEISNSIQFKQIRAGHKKEVSHHQIRTPCYLQFRETVEYIKCLSAFLLYNLMQLYCENLKSVRQFQGINL